MPKMKKKKASRKPAVMPARAALALEVYQTVWAAVESFYEPPPGGDPRVDQHAAGADLAYLLGAILESRWATWDDGYAFLDLLREKFPASHAVWRFVTVVRRDERRST